MRQIICALLLLSLIVKSNKSTACDVCGCGVSSQGLGLLPQFSNHFVGVQYSYFTTHTSHPSLFEGKPNEESDQQYQQLQVWGRYQLSKRFQLFAFAPYYHSKSSNQTENHTNSGIGDVSVMGSYSIPLKEKEKKKQLLLVGLGLKLPTGSFDASAINSSSNLPLSQTGTGAFDFLANINYTHKWATWGYNIDANYNYTTVNKAEYKFGNKLSISSSAFKWVEKKQFKIVPQVGIKIEYSLRDYTNFTKKYLNEQTGGVAAFTTIGSQFFYKKVGAKVNFQLPFFQQYAQNILQYNARIEAGIFILL